jgi:phage shock protein C
LAEVQMMGDTITPTTPPETGRSRLTRSKRDRVVAGVCGGLGSYFAVDPVVFRIAFVVLALSGWGGGVLLYVIAWLVMPEGSETEPATAYRPRQGATFIGLALILAGGVALIDRILPNFDLMFWPLAVIAVGVAVLIGGDRNDRAA